MERGKRLPNKEDRLKKQDFSTSNLSFQAKVAKLRESEDINMKVIGFETTDQSHMFVEVALLSQKCTETPREQIQIDTEIRYQSIDGFGASFTDSASYLINYQLEERDRESLMKKLFSETEGIGLSVVRQTMGACDYARKYYSYQEPMDNEDDFEMQFFSIHHDMEHTIPLLKKMLEINPKAKVMASPWSAPAWMKTTKSMIGGTLREVCKESYATYFARFIKAYKEQGIHIYAVTPQNEPMYVPPHYPGMQMDAREQIDFINNYLGPKFREEAFDTKILAYDHNWDMPEYPIAVLKETREFVSGVAWHVYASEPKAQSQVVACFPDIETYYTEASGGEWISPYSVAFSSMMKTNIGTLRNHSKTVILWNMALDEENGPVVPGFGNSTCRGVVTVNQKTKELKYNLEYYALAHLSKYVKQDAIRVETNEIENVSNVAFQNPDGSVVIVISNDTNQRKELAVNYKECEVLYTLDPNAAITIKFENEKGDKGWKEQNILIS